MATHNPKEVRESGEQTLNYIYRGEGHEHAVQPGDVVHIGGNLFSPNPINDGNTDLKQMIAEFIAQAAIYKGKGSKGSKLFKHYVLSLAPGEQLNEAQWLEFATEYMEALGYDNTTKWTSAIHNDTHNQQYVGHTHHDEKTGKYFAHSDAGGLVEVTGSQHLHIMSCLVRNELGGPLVSTSNDYQKGWEVMRKYEKKFGLRELQNPDENFGFNYTKSQLKSYGSRDKAIKNDEAAIIRARFKNLYETDGRPRTITDLVVGLLKRDVHVSVSTDSDNNPVGIAYKGGERGNWISGSKVKATRFTWGKLISKEHIDYNPERDNPILGLAPAPGQFTLSVAVTSSQFKLLKAKKALYRVRSREDNLFVDFSFLNSQRERDLAILITSMMKILRLLFANDEIYQDYIDSNYFDSIAYEPASKSVYDTLNESMTMIEIDRDTILWRLIPSENPEQTFTPENTLSFY
jgi:hypothetical protein